jgi:hypothetical protein
MKSAAVPDTYLQTFYICTPMTETGLWQVYAGRKFHTWERLLRNRALGPFFTSAWFTTMSWVFDFYPIMYLGTYLRDCKPKCQTKWAYLGFYIPSRVMQVRKRARGPFINTALFTATNELVFNFNPGKKRHPRVQNSSNIPYILPPNYQMAIISTKWPQYIPNDQRI